MVLGEKNGKAKLTTEQVREIKSLLALKECSMNKIATMYNVSRECIKSIHKGRTWVHVKI